MSLTVDSGYKSDFANRINDIAVIVLKSMFFATDDISRFKLRHTINYLRQSTQALDAAYIASHFT